MMKTFNKVFKKEAIELGSSIELMRSYQSYYESAARNYFYKINLIIIVKTVRTGIKSEDLIFLEEL